MPADHAVGGHRAPGARLAVSRQAHPVGEAGGRRRDRERRELEPVGAPGETAIEGVDTDSVLTRLDAVTGEFRKAVLAGTAGGGTVPESTRVLACLAVCRLPVDMSG